MYLVTVSAALALAGCGAGRAPRASEEGLGRVVAEISDVPADVRCIRAVRGFGWINSTGAVTLTAFAIPLPALSGAVSIALGESSCAAFSGRPPQCWGAELASAWGALGNGFVGDQLYPADVLGSGEAVDVTVSHGDPAFGYTVCATRADGAGYCWGSNVGGKLGIGTVDSEYFPRRVTLP